MPLLEQSEEELLSIASWRKVLGSSARELVAWISRPPKRERLRKQRRPRLPGAQHHFPPATLLAFPSEHLVVPDVDYCDCDLTVDL